MYLDDFVLVTKQEIFSSESPSFPVMIMLRSLSSMASVMRSAK